MERSGAEELLRERVRLRSERDFVSADAIRDQLRSGGWEVVDGPAGSQLRPIEMPPAARHITLMTVLHGWVADAERWLDSMFQHHPQHDFEVLLVDNSADPEVEDWALARRGERVRSLHLGVPAGFGAAVNAGFNAAAGEVVILFDPGVEARGDVVAPLLLALADPAVAAAGPYGLRLEGREFVSHAGPEVEALEGYCLACRRSDALEAGGFDEKFRFYRIADLEFTFRLRSQGGRALVVPGLPLERHVHRLWEATEPGERTRLSRKNFYRFLDRWGKRADPRLE